MARKFKVGDKVQIRTDICDDFGTGYWKYAGRWGTVNRIDGPDEDGEQVFGVMFGRTDGMTCTASMVK